MVEFQIDTQIDDILDLTVDDLNWQPVFRDAYPQHTAGNRQGFKNSDWKTGTNDVLGSCESARPSADDGNRFIRVEDLYGLNLFPGFFVDLICHKAF